MTEIQKLTAKERIFFYNYLKVGTLAGAFRKAFPSKAATMKKPDLAGHKLMRRIKKKYDWDRLLDEAGLGYERIYAKLEELLEATMIKHYRGQELGPYTDNATRMRALELLVELHGRRRQVVEHQGEVTFVAAVQEAYERRRELHIVKDEDVSNG